MEKGKLVVTTNFENLTVIDSILDILRKESLISDSFEFRFRTVMSEIISNAMIHGNQLDPIKKVFVEFYLEGNHVCLCVQDEGFGFDPFNIPNPTTSQCIEKEGGRGIFIVKNLVDDLSYCSGENAIRFSIKL